MENNAQNELQRRRQEMFKSMGVANAGRVLNETAVTGGGVNSEMAAKIAAIKSGAARGAVSNVIKSLEGGSNVGSTGGAASRDFKPLPDSSKNKFSKEQVNPEYSQKIENFDLPSGRSSELSAIESMFGSDGPSRGSRQNMGNQQFSQNPLNTELHLDDIVMPSFNPHAAIQQKAMRQQQQQQQPNNNVQSPYLKYANENPIQQEYFEDIAPQGQQQQGMNFNMNALQMMMETIAKGIAEKTIRSVLNEYTEQQKGKVFIEKFDKERSIMKTSDGKYYRVTQVEPKKK